MKHIGFGGQTRALPHEDEATSSSQSSSMADFDRESYRPFLDGLELTDEQANELLSIVWDIMRMWVEMDLPADTCGQITQVVIQCDADDSPGIDLD